MKDYQPFSAEIKGGIIDEIKNNFGHIYSDELIAIFIKIMEESTLVELDFADLLVFLHESRNGFKIFTTQQALTEFVKSSASKPTSLFGYKMGDSRSIESDKAKRLIIALKGNLKA
ncbi:hypothetical protein [Pseudoalteromonas sp. SaAl2]